MIIPDVNLLVYAHIASSKDYVKAAQWWERTVTGNETVGLPNQVITGFLRVTTNKKFLIDPLSSLDAAEFVEKWFSQPNVVLLTAGEACVRDLIQMVKELNLTGNLLSDAAIAVHALRNEAVIHTADKDFRRFPAIRWFNPLTGEASND